MTMPNLGSWKSCWSCCLDGKKSGFKSLGWYIFCNFAREKDKDMKKICDFISRWMGALVLLTAVFAL